MHDTTRSLARRSAMGLALAALLAAPAGAQDHRFALGLGGGWSQPANLTPGLVPGTTLEPGWVAGGQLEAWPGSGQVGLRLGGTYMDRAVEEDPNSRYSVYSADLSFLVRILPAGRARWVVPYISFGGGASMYVAAEGAPPLAGGLYGDDPATRAVALAGGGFDLLPFHRYGLRIEGVDRIVLPSIGEGPDADGLPISQGPQVTAMLQIRGGWIGDSRRTIAAAPAPAPRAAPAPRQQAREPEPQPVVRTAAAPAPAVRSAVEDELRANLEEWQRRVSLLTQRVDSLETALTEAELESRRAAAARASAPAPAVAAAPAPAPARRPAGAPAKGPLFTVQVGAFVEEETARIWEQRLRARNLPVWVTPAVVRGMRVTRVRVGALPTSAEADGLARLLKSQYGWPVWVDRVADVSHIPVDAVDATRSYMRGN